MFTKTRCCMLTNCCGHIELICFFNRLPIDSDTSRIKKIILTTLDAQRVCKALLKGFTINMPLTTVIGTVSSCSESLGKQFRPGWSITVSAFYTRKFISTNRLCVIAGEQCTTGRPTPSSVIALRKPQPTISKPIEIWCFYFTSVTPKVREPHIIS